MLSNLGRKTLQASISRFLQTLGIDTSSRNIRLKTDPDIDLEPDVITKLYNRWANMRRKPHLMCPEWREDKNVFYRDMGLSFSDKNNTLCRIESTLPFSKDNCFWGQPKDVYRNFSRKVLYEYEGSLYEKEAMAGKLGIAIPTLELRVEKGVIKKVYPFQDVENIGHKKKGFETLSEKKEAATKEVLRRLLEVPSITIEQALSIIEPFSSL